MEKKVTTARPNLVITLSSSVLFRDLASVECLHFLKWLTQVARVLYKRSRHPSIYTAHEDQATELCWRDIFSRSTPPSQPSFTVCQNIAKKWSRPIRSSRADVTIAQWGDLCVISAISVMGYFRYSVMGFDCTHQLLLGSGGNYFYTNGIPWHNDDR